jgi:hypothetical protein
MDVMRRLRIADCDFRDCGSGAMELETRSTKRETDLDSPMTTMSTSEGAKGQRGKGAKGTTSVRCSATRSRQDCAWDVAGPDLAVVSNFEFRISDLGGQGREVAAEGVGSWR